MLKKPVLMIGLIACLALAGAQAQGQDNNKTEKRPGSGEPLVDVNPAYTIEQARPDDFQPNVGALCFLPNGKLAVLSFTPANNGVFREEPNGTLYILDNPTSTDTSKIKVHKVTDQLYNPLGMNYVDGALYISDRDEVSKWTDTDNDGYPDKRETFASGWISDNYHHFTFGLPYHDGYFYVTLSTNITFDKMIKEENIKGRVDSLNGPNPAERGCLLKIDAKTGQYTIVVGGLRTPNGVSLATDGNILMPDNQGAWKPASGIYVAQQGAFYGHYNNTEATSDFYPNGGVPSAFSDQPITPPAIWIPQNECANSPAEMIAIPQGQPFAGQYLMAEITRGGLRRVMLEEVDGTWQGAIFRHSQGFEAGLNRLEWGPDGCLYVGGMGSGGNWGWRPPGKGSNALFGLQRMRPTGKTAFEFREVHATKEGFEVYFTKPVKLADLQDINNWAINAWTYKQTPQYGGPKIPKDDKDQVVAIDYIATADDGMAVKIVLKGERKPNHVYHIRSSVNSEAGEKMWSNEVWYTFHKAPKE